MSHYNLYLDKLNELKQLLEEIRIELSELNRYKAFKAYYGGMGRYEVLSDDVIDLNFKDLISRIDEVISDV